MHIAIEASEATATRFLAALRSSLGRVLLFPEAGAPRDQLAPSVCCTECATRPPLPTKADFNRA
jgi:plasmid stabilization system protein ParE